MLAGGGGGIKPQKAFHKRTWHYMPFLPHPAALLPTESPLFVGFRPFRVFSGLKWPLCAQFGRILGLIRTALGSGRRPFRKKWRSWVKTGVPGRPRALSP